MARGEGVEWKRKKIRAAARKGLTEVGLEELSPQGQVAGFGQGASPSCPGRREQPLEPAGHLRALASPHGS